MRFTNQHNIGLSMAVYLVHDDYDYDPRPNAISVTGLLKPLRQAILSQRIESKIATMDISQLMASSLGTAVHEAVEKAWSNGNHILAMRKLGYSQKVIDRVVVNPNPRIVITPEMRKDPNRPIPVYLELRSEKEIEGIIVTGKFDFVGDGELEDIKTTGVYTYMKKSNDEKYRLQGSIYRWLNPDIITSDRLLINYKFTDWSKGAAISERQKGYPQMRMLTVPFTLLSLEETEQWVRNKVQSLKAYINRDESVLPACTPEELWQDPTVYKYYKNPKSKDRSTKNFDNFAEAQQRLMQDGSVGIIDIVPGKAKACLWCAAAPICSQAKQLALDGLLDMEL